MRRLGFWLLAGMIPLIGAGAPNFVVILVDDLGARDLGVEGSLFYETPNIDRLARSGMRFEQGYAACSVCSPSRASIMTGKATPRHGITTWIGATTERDWNRSNDRVIPVEYVHNLPKEDTTIAEALRDAGYKTFYAGKWHLGSQGSWPEDHGFEINKGGWDMGLPKGGYFAPWKNPRLPPGPDGESLTRRLARETVQFIRDSRDEPFFAVLSFYAVHGPIETTRSLWEKYRAKAEALNVSSRFLIDRTLPVRQVQDNPVYAGLLETMDDAVGMVLAALEELELDENTVIIFTSDNGGASADIPYATSNLPFRGSKGRQWEGGLRVPFYVRAPGITASGMVTDVPAVHMDIYPTVLQLAGLPLMPAQHMDGMSLVPVLRGDACAARDLFWHYPHYGNQGGEPAAIIRSGDWKLIHYYEDGRDELYNLTDDIRERNDLASSRPEQTLVLRKKLDTWLIETGARTPKRNPDFNVAEYEDLLRKLREEKLPDVEKKHEECVRMDWQPNLTWWDSSLLDDD